MDNDSNIVSAFDILLEEFDFEIEYFSQLISEESKNKKFKEAMKLLEIAENINIFKQKILDLKNEWISQFYNKNNHYIESEKTQRRNLGKLRKGERTNEREFRLPILQALIELGGSAPMSEVLDVLYNIVKDKLKTVDYETLPSSPETPRWRNTAQWARNSLVREGYLINNSPRGIWEISEKGRKFIQS